MTKIRRSHLPYVLFLVLSLLAGQSSAVVGGGPEVEQRIAAFWARINALQPTDYISSGDLGQWALNVIDRDATARISVADFRAATAQMQGAIDRAGRGPSAPTPTPQFGTRQNPAGPGLPMAITISSILKNYDVVVSLQSTVRGPSANQMVKAANMFNSDPKPGMEYLLASIRLTYVKGPTTDTAYDASGFDFSIISSLGVEYEGVSCVEPTPRLRTTLYAGASTEGWACFMVNQSDLKPTMAFGRNYDGSGGRWWRIGW